MIQHESPHQSIGWESVLRQSQLLVSFWEMVCDRQVIKLLSYQGKGWLMLYHLCYHY
jgi:hypothetical protein